MKKAAAIILLSIVMLLSASAAAFAAGSDNSPWYGIWEASDGEWLYVSDVSDHGITLHYHGWYADHSGLFDSIYQLPFENSGKTVAAETADVLQRSGDRYLFTLSGDQVILSSRKPDKYFYRASGAASGSASGNSQSTGTASDYSPFYGIWCMASKNRAEMEKSAAALLRQGFAAKVFVTTDWSNLNSEKWYVVSAGTYRTEQEARAALPGVKAIYGDAYVKYSGAYQGYDTQGSGYVSTDYSPFYGIWCMASKNRAEMEKSAAALLRQGFAAKVFVTTDWSNLNSEKWYVVSAGTYRTEQEARAALSSVKAVYGDAYVKYSGAYIGR